MLRKMQLEDIDEVVKLEQQSFTLPWEKAFFKRELKENPYGNYFVVEEDNKIIGYCGLWVIYERSEITTIAVAKEYRRQHYGEMMMRYMEAYANEKGCENISLEVRVSNDIAQKMYLKLGYIIINTRKSYYEDNHEDAYLMMKAVGDINE